MADFVGSIACPSGLSACHGIHRSSVPGGRAARPARHQEGCTMTEAAVSFAGNLTDDPELRHTESGVARAMFRVAISGRREQEASFFTVVVWRDQADHAAQSLSRAAGWSSWAGSSSGYGPPRTAAPDPPSRSWLTSWGRACGGRRRPRTGRHAARSRSFSAHRSTASCSARSRRSGRASMSPWAMRRPWARMMRMAKAA
jgi:hypothetical protein